jgi:periodic tryptophan protein 1
MSMITAAQWVRRGFAAPFPTKYDLDETEYERIAELAKLQLDDAEEDLREAQEENNGEKKKSSGDDDEEMEVEDSKKSKDKASSKSL